MGCSQFKTALLYPPIVDFTQPHPSIPYLAGFLRAKGEDVLIRDINIEAQDTILSSVFLQTCQKMIVSKFEKLDQQPFLRLKEHPQYQELLKALGIDTKVITNIEHIKQGLKDPEQFYNYECYLKNVTALKEAFQIISSAYHPIRIEPCEYLTPYFLTSNDDILEQCQAEINPLVSFYQKQLIPWIKKIKPAIIGFSTTYPTQVLQMLAMAQLIRRHFPDIHLCAGGAFICRMILNMPPDKHAILRQYLDSIILYEGETALYNLIQALKTKQADHSMDNTILYDRQTSQIHYPSQHAIIENLDHIPPPDYDGYPLDLYLSPRLVLPYAPTRGCYWNRCTFCHYGATHKGTSKYREKKIEQIITDLDVLADKYKVNHFAFSVDVIAPKTILAIAEGIIRHQRSYLWSTDIKVDDFFTKQNCQTIKQGGCQSVAIGLESACSRILKLMGKGIQPKQAQKCIRNLSKAGICTQIMTFLNFPTERVKEAMDTIRFISMNKSYISLFTMGDFGLLPGAEIYHAPEKYGINRIYYPENDRFKLLVQYETSYSNRNNKRIESAYNDLALQYAPQDFPFVGAVSNNHTLLYFERFGKKILKQLNVATDDFCESKKFKRCDIPVMQPEIKMITTNYCLSEIKSTMQNRQPGNTVKTYPQKTMYLLIQSMNWLETPSQAKYLLKMCNGKNTAEDISNSIAPHAWEAISSVLNNLYTYNILTCKNIF